MNLLPKEQEIAAAMIHLTPVRRAELAANLNKIKEKAEQIEAVQKATFEEGVQHAVQGLQAMLDGKGWTWYSDNPLISQLYGRLLQISPRRSAVIENPCADRVLELVKEKGKADKEVNALPTSLHGTMPSEAQKEKIVTGLKNKTVRIHDWTAGVVFNDFCKGDDT